MRLAQGQHHLLVTRRRRLWTAPWLARVFAGLSSCSSIHSTTDTSRWARAGRRKPRGSGAGRSVGQPSRSRGLFGMSMWYVSHSFLIVLFILSCSWSSPCLPPLLSFQFVQSPPPGGLADLLSSSSLGTSWLGRGTLFLHASSLRVLNPQIKFSQRPYRTFFSVFTLPTHPTTYRKCCIQYIV